MQEPATAGATPTHWPKRCTGRCCWRTPATHLLALPTTELLVAHVAGVLEAGRGRELACQAVQRSGLTERITTPEVRCYQYGSYAKGLVVVMALQRSYLTAMFHRCVTARLLEHCPVQVLVLPTLAEAATEK